MVFGSELSGVPCMTRVLSSMSQSPRAGSSVSSDMFPQPTEEDELTTADFNFSELDLELNNCQFDKEAFQLLVTRSSRLHLDMLFYHNSNNTIGKLCWKMYKVVIKKIGGTLNYGGLGGWRDMAFKLGLKTEDADYIEHSVKTCPTEMTLRVVRQDDDACFNKLLTVLFEMERYDVITLLGEPLKELLDSLEQLSHDKPLRPKYLSNILPDVLRLSNSEDDEEEEPIERCKQENDVTDLANLEEAKKDMIMLTYAEDGLKVAQKILSKLKRKLPNLMVVILEDVRSEIMESPEQTIRSYLDKVDYVIPILTMGYFTQIQSNKIDPPSMTDNLDHAYARFIYRLCTDHYIYGTGCLNKKVRAIVPDEAKEVLCKLYPYPVFISYTWQKDLYVLIKKMYNL